MTERQTNEKGDFSEPSTEKLSPGVHWLKRLLARTVLGLFGWKTGVDETLVHCHPKYIIVAAPHTSNWDAIFGGLGFMAENIGTSIIIKQEWINVPVIGWVLSSFGCIGIDRSGSRNTVRQIVQLFKERPQFVMVITPEGTRKKVKYWKSGFYSVAKKANVPLMLGCPDYRRKVCYIAPIVVNPTGDIQADMSHFDDYLSKITPRYPEKRSEMVFNVKQKKVDA